MLTDCDITRFSNRSKPIFHILLVTSKSSFMCTEVPKLVQLVKVPIMALPSAVSLTPHWLRRLGKGTVQGNMEDWKDAVEGGN